LSQKISVAPGRCNPANLVLIVTIAIPIGDFEIAMFKIHVTVDKNPGEYNSRDPTPPFVRSIGAAWRVSKLFSTSIRKSQSLYADTMIGFLRADKYDIAAFTPVSVFAGKCPH
jgi:hypothetical protein